MTDIITGLQAIINNSEGRLYDHERAFLKTAIVHIQGIRAVAGKATGEGPSFAHIKSGLRPSDMLMPGRYDVTGDGIALTSIAHPEGPAVADDADINPDSVVTIEPETANETH